MFVEIGKGFKMRVASFGLYTSWKAA